MSNWQEELAQGFSNSKELLSYLKINDDLSQIDKVEVLFKTKVPKGFVNRMQKGNRFDPLLLQVLATNLELEEVKGYSSDPLQEKEYNPLPGIIHKYFNRALLTLSGACAVNCRYCFRRHFPYGENTPGKKGIQAIVDYLIQHPEIDEIILSGGDPLLLNNQYYRYLLDALKECSSVEVLRIHSRIPIVLPSRIEPAWVELLNAYPWQKVMVTHANHPAELNDEVATAIRLLKNNDWLVLNQSVLLKNINDDVDILVKLSKSLHKMGILPYYLHILDSVAGAAHFAVNLDDSKSLYANLQSRISGYLVPRLAQEQPGIPHKTLIK
jgi:KamA family protein